MYGLQKVHKADTPLRPVLSTEVTYIYVMSQQLIKLPTQIIETKSQFHTRSIFVTKHPHVISIRQLLWLVMALQTFQ